MKRNTVRFVLLLLAMLVVPWPGRAQNTFPRNGDEALALRIHRAYRESQARLVQLEANRVKVKGFITEVAPASTMVGTAVAPEDTAELNEIIAEIAQTQKWCRQLEAFWEKNRALPPAPARSFSGRYGPLSNGDQRSTDPKYDKIEYAIRSFPFNETPPRPTASAARAVDVNGTWEALSPDADGKNFITVSVAGGQFTATSEYVSHGKPYHWKMTGKMTAEGSVVAEMVHSGLATPVTHTFQLSPDGKQFTGTIGTWVRR